MENNPTINVSNKPVIETRKCSCCGKTLPLSAFEKFGVKGYHTKCKRCEGKEDYEDERFKDIDSRDLILELRHRGYRGELEQVTINKVVI